jgi:hypothetical protein
MPAPATHPRNAGPRHVSVAGLGERRVGLTWHASALDPRELIDAGKSVSLTRPAALGSRALPQAARYPMLST